MKKCIIENKENSWVMKVDGKIFYFLGLALAEYLRNIHTKMGYEVVFEATPKTDSDNQ